MSLSNPEGSKTIVTNGQISTFISDFLILAGASPDLSVSAWKPHADEGAVLEFFRTADQAPPLDLQGTALMFFAMEEMGQVPPSEFAHQIQDPTNVLVSIRDHDHGKLLGVILFVGSDAEKLPSDLCLNLAREFIDHFRDLSSTDNRQVAEPTTTSARESEIRTILAQVALESCALRLETYIPGVKAHREDFDDPNTPSRALAAGGTQAVVVSSAQSASITLNLIFLEGNLKDLVSETLKLPLEKTTVEVIRDFFREFLNQTQGWIQKCLLSQSIRTKNGMPLSVTSEDPIPSFLSHLHYDAGTIMVLNRYRFELRVSVKVLNETGLSHLGPISVRDSVNQASEEVDIEALLDAM